MLKVLHCISGMAVVLYQFAAKQQKKMNIN